MDIALKDYQTRFNETPFERAMKFQKWGPSAEEVVGYVFELHARKGDTGTLTYMPRVTRTAIQHYRTWIGPRVVCEVREDSTYKPSLESDLIGAVGHGHPE